MRLTGKSSLTRRLTLLFAAASAVVLLALGFVIHSSVERHFEEGDMKILSGKLEWARHTLERIKSVRDLDGLPRQIEDSLVGHHELAILVLGPKREVVFATPGINFPQVLVTSNGAKNSVRPAVWAQGEMAYRGISAALPTGVKEWPPLVVAATIEISRHQGFMKSFLKTLWWFVSGAVLLTGFLGWIATRRGLAPLHSMRDKAAAVTAQHLDHRLPVDSIPAELSELAQTLNSMLDRLEDVFHRLSDFSADLAHELRTPVGNLMMQTQVALSRARNADDYRQVLESNAEELERLARMIGDMLFLAKAENGLVVPSRENVDLAAEARDLFDFYDALAEEKCIALTLEGGGRVLGDRLMLRRALSNLLSNAIHHTPAHGRIVVKVTEDATSTSIFVENNGEEIPPERMARLFDRFYRVDPSRRHGSEGAGLGLAITKSIVSAHGGKVSVRSSNGVTRLTMNIPRLNR